MSSTSIASPASTRSIQPHWYDAASVRGLATVLAFTGAAAYEALHLSALGDENIWSHLRTGLWILQSHSAPRTDLFSQFPSLPWIDSSWAFDVVAAAAHRCFGLAGLPLLLMLLQVAIAIALFMLARAGSRRFWPALLLCAVAQFSVAPMLPRPALCSLVLLTCELALLLYVRRTGNVRALFWLPLLLVIWANLDRQFSYGLLALALFCIAAVAENLGRSRVTWFDTGAPAIGLGNLAMAAGASVAATFISPYGFRLYELLWQSATNSAADRYFPQLHSMRFRQPQDYVLMLLAMAAFFALGRRRSRDLFLISLLIVSAVISFRFQRDAWLVVVVSVGVIGNAIAGKPAMPSQDLQSTTPKRARNPEMLATAALVLIVFVAVVLLLPGKAALMAEVSKNFPVRASDYIRQNHLPQPLFNAYEWGGFLTWYLPEYPVFIDGRADMYGDAINVPYFQLMQAEIPLQSHPGFAQSQTILLQADSPLGQALSTLPAFRVAYKDAQAVVLVRAE